VGVVYGGLDDSVAGGSSTPPVFGSKYLDSLFTLPVSLVPFN